MHVFYGDAVRREVMQHIGVEKARILVIAISDLSATRHIVAQARELAPNLHIIVRTRYMSELQELYRLGANQVIPEEFETSIEIFSRVLTEYGVARTIIQREIEEIPDSRRAAAPIPRRRRRSRVTPGPPRRAP